jgi:hypothetical protein
VVLLVVIIHYAACSPAGPSSSIHLEVTWEENSGFASAAAAASTAAASAATTAAAGTARAVSYLLQLRRQLHAELWRQLDEHVISHGLDVCRATKQHANTANTLLPVVAPSRPHAAASHNESLVMHV